MKKEFDALKSLILTPENTLIQPPCPDRLILDAVTNFYPSNTIFRNEGKRFTRTEFLDCRSNNNYMMI